ncbi:type II secretion system F family protein [Sulfitobacter mediterraneus]|uniref:type II secretion system F family protein n=1 Tax=Sulfitobacter mediterraneus TaxID=83219 RepID=UPI0019321D91|nr:type II secretion system F family protein [Sulfitobacter mediterraneus]MBM1635193.1 type II secretion system F family protein [Sulfitobacter mediterraneus]MBM1643044.1 type II secretion system F family protein [Sulfitobacter mediterraneus]MBM1647092.1 type II secretion system F family protein [Sulfitobacter mediterraneus]MBM1651134.1 type II secretion system F family protein [Sulfitobacter mediterraneus]MBM1655139.1 type II secretion system F family protein [Sulfitobacter mediterraneus]
MPAFSYQAVDPAGKKTRGLIEAASPAAVRAQLRDRDLLPLAVEATQAKPGSGRSFGAHRLSLKKQVLVSRQLATLVGAQVRIEDALKIVTDQMTNSRDISLLLNLRSAIVDGRSFAEALEDVPDSFDDYYRASVLAAESAGKLPEVLNHLATHIEDRARNRQSLQLALIYPTLLALVSVGVIIALLTFVVPDIVRVFTARGAELPGLTRGLIAVSDWIARWGATIAALGAVAGLSTVALLRMPALRSRWDGWLMRAPLFGPLVLRINAAQFSGTLATLVQSGVPLAEALRAAAGTVPNRRMRAHVGEITQAVQDGMALSQAVEAAGVFPPMLVAMIASGEASGRLGESLQKAATDQAEGLKATVSTMVALVEPGVLLIMGGVVMLLVMAILMPIVGLNALAG